MCFTRQTEVTHDLLIRCPCAVGAVALVPAALSAAGFTSAGIAAGSIGAKMMSGAAVANGGGVAAGSLVAVLQSAGELHTPSAGITGSEMLKCSNTADSTGLHVRGKPGSETTIKSINVQEMLL